ncbi:MAG TPA: enolase C-terminal domain-like protein [Rectinemataceae bacterium]|nr:enolase C-terminal domain-like protein [Rectinemataceae bacterium]
MEIKVFRLRLPLRNPFRIAHGSYAWRENIFHWIGHGGGFGMGEAPVVPYYGISADEIEAELRAAVSPRLVEAALEGGRIVGAALEGGRAYGAALEDGRADGAAFAHPVSRSAIETAVLALRARLTGLKAAELLGFSPAELGCGTRAPASSFTVAYDEDAEAMARIAAESGFRRLKIKAGIPGDVERIRLLRERLPEAIIRVDANQGWSLEEAPARIAELEALGVELIEEPIRGGPRELERLAAGTGVPILLDESARDLEQVRLYAKEAPSVAGIVIKTAKNGGPSASLELARAARDEGMEVMVSSMVETSLGLSSALPLAPLCRWCDLDAPLLLGSDPFTGLSYEAEAPVLAPEGVLPGPELAALIAGLPSLARSNVRGGAGGEARGGTWGGPGGGAAL